MAYSLFRRAWDFIHDAAQIAYLAVVIRILRLHDLIRTIARYYRNAKFRQVDRIFLFAYLFDNPYTLARRWLQARGEEDVYSYGETPLATVDLISRRAQITSSDVVYELGSGRGRSCFWLRCLVGCQVVGIEYIPYFVMKARGIAAKAGVDGVEFRCEDFLKSDLSAATVVYLYGSNMDDAVIEKLVERLSRLRKGTRIITASFALSDYAADGAFTLLSTLEGDFLWGTATVYIQQV